MTVTIELFKKVFAKHKNSDEGDWERSEDIDALEEQVGYRAEGLKAVRGSETYEGDPLLSALLEEVDEMAFALSELDHRWKKMDTFAVKGALKEVGKSIHALKQRFGPIRPVQGVADERDQYVGDSIEAGLGRLDVLYKETKDALEARKVEETGKLTGRSKGDLVEGWNGITERYEYKHPDEWKRLVDRDKLDLDFLFDIDFETNRRKQMEKVGSGVHVQVDDGKSKERLETERKATALMRSGLTQELGQRTGTAKEDVKNNSDLAGKLVTLLEENPDLLDTDGLLSRIVGSIDGQGQFEVPDNKWGKETDKSEKARKQAEQNETNRSHAGAVIEQITASAQRLKEGKGEGQDGNRILQFISCFVDGLTEVTEGKKKPIEQFDKAWPMFAELFDLDDEDKGVLLRRVQGYKEIAGGVADTLSGKGTRKDDTRGGFMPTDTDYKIDDEDALIKGDISGSMHSCLLAQELSECLLGREVENERGEKVLVKQGIKQRGEPVLVTDPKVLDARALDALALTAGGKIGSFDLVLHTAYEMINGMRAISGAPKVNQSQATAVMAMMLKGTSFTRAMESILPTEKFPWLGQSV